MVPDPGVRSGKVQVQRGALAQLGGDLAAVHRGDAPFRVEDRKDDRAVEVLVAGFADEAQFLQA